MTTPQSILDRLSYNVKDLNDMLTGKYEDEKTRQNIYQMIKQMQIEMQDIVVAQKRQENLMDIIVKLLSK